MAPQTVGARTREEWLAVLTPVLRDEAEVYVAVLFAAQLVGAPTARDLLLDAAAHAKAPLGMDPWPKAETMDPAERCGACGLARRLHWGPHPPAEGRCSGWEPVR